MLSLNGLNEHLIQWINSQESDPNGPRDGDREKRDRHINKAGDTIQGRPKF